jgi:hypothetical protein
VPPLVTTSPAGTPVGQAGVLGAPGTTVLFGDGDFFDRVRSGGRLTAGAWLDHEQTIGVEGYFFGLEGLADHFTAASDGSSILARPFFNAQSGHGDALLIAFPGTVRGNTTINVTTSDFFGSGVDGRVNLCCGCCYRVDLLGGYRFLHLDEGVGVTETEIASGPNAPIPQGTSLLLHDNVGTGNQFHGGEFGLDAEFRHCCWYVDVLAKVALGGTLENASIFGNVQSTSGINSPAGFLALPTNSGSFHRDVFAVVPEVGLTLGCQVTDNLRLSVGYTFIYWSNVVRPGNEIDLTINPSQLPPGRLSGPARPAFAFHDTDYWAQGINFGVEVRY